MKKQNKYNVSSMNKRLKKLLLVQGLVVIILFILSVLAFFLIVLPCLMISFGISKAEITLDGYFSFLGGTIMGVGSILVSIIALTQNWKLIEEERQIALESRRYEICPCLQISLNYTDIDDLYEIVIDNVAIFPAIDIYIDDEYKTKYIKAGDKCTCQFLNEQKCKDGYPSSVLLQFKDVDNNCWHQIFKYRSIENGMTYYDAEMATIDTCRE